MRDEMPKIVVTGKKRVLRYDQSPINPKRWLAELECGHERWITAQRKPTAKEMLCGKCRAK